MEGFTMSRPSPEEDWDLDLDAEYYFLYSNKVARIVYDADLEEYIISEAMGPDGVWFDYNVDEVLEEGEPISEEEAFGLMHAFGGEW